MEGDGIEGGFTYDGQVPSKLPVHVLGDSWVLTEKPPLDF